MDLGGGLAVATFVLLLVWPLALVLDWQFGGEAWGGIASVAFVGAVTCGGLTLIVGDGWDGASLPEKAVTVTAIGLAITLTVVFVVGSVGSGVALVFLPPYEAFRWVRRARRIVRYYDSGFDEDGYKLHKDEEGNQWYEVDYWGSRAYRVKRNGNYTRYCAYLDDGKVRYVLRDGSEPRRIPRNFRKQPILPADVPPDAYKRTMQDYDRELAVVSQG